MARCSMLRRASAARNESMVSDDASMRSRDPETSQAQGESPAKSLHCRTPRRCRFLHCRVLQRFRRDLGSLHRGRYCAGRTRAVRGSSPDGDAQSGPPRRSGGCRGRSALHVRGTACACARPASVHRPVAGGWLGARLCGRPAPRPDATPRCTGRDVSAWCSRSGHPVRTAYTGESPEPLQVPRRVGSWSAS